MTPFVLDTSVAIAWYLPETFSASARSWQARFVRGDVGFVVPPLHYLEFGNVLRTYVRRKELSEAAAREMHALHLDAPLEVAEPRRADVFDVALQFDATVYDAVYIALARERRAPLLTAERRSTPWVRRLGTLVQLVS